MADNKLEENLPQQGKLGAPAAGVAGTIVPGAPTSSSNEGLAGVLEAGTPVNLTTVVEEKKEDVRAGGVTKFESLDSILKNIHSGYITTDEDPVDSPGLEGDTFFGNSPPAVHPQRDIVKMEVEQETSRNKRKADASLVGGTSSDEVIVPTSSLRRRRRRYRLTDRSPDKVCVTDHIDLTAEYETPLGSDFGDVESVGESGSVKSNALWAHGKTDDRASTPKKRGKKSAAFGSKIDFKPELDKISPSQLLEMSATNAGLVGLECVEIVEAVRSNSRNFQGSWSGRMRVKLNKINDVIRALTQKAESSGDPSLLEVRIRELSDELLATKKESSQERIELDKLKAENETLRREILSMKTELRKLDKMEEENDNLWKGIKDLRAELASLKKGRVAVERPGNIKDRTSGFSDRPTVPGDTSSAAVIGESRATETPRAVSAAERTTDRQPERLRKDSRKEEPNVVDPDAMEWERLPQRTPGPQRPRVVANVQLVPPRGSGSATKRRKKISNRDIVQDPLVGPKPNKEASRNVPPSKGDGKARGITDGGVSGKRRNSKPTLPRDAESNPRRKPKGPVPPRTAAVAITGRSEGFSYKDILIKARSEISLNDLKIESTRLRRAANGGYLIEILDKDNAGKAQALREKLRVLIPEGQATVACPVTYGELRFIGLDDTILPEEIMHHITSEGKCEVADVKIGNIIPMRNGLNTVWARCPISVAASIAAKQRIRLGWTVVRVELLKARPVQCYKCWGFGHVRFSCTSAIDRSKSCFNCGGEGHSLRDCGLPSRCVVCESAGASGNHRMGSALCDTNRRRKPGKIRPGYPAEAVTERGSGKLRTE